MKWRQEEIDKNGKTWAKNRLWKLYIKVNNYLSGMNKLTAMTVRIVLNKNRKGILLAADPKMSV